MNKKSVLVTGAAGFIGFHTALKLKSRGDNVIGIDNFNDYYSVSLKRDRAAILNAHQIPLVEADICDGLLLKKMMHSYAITHLLHLAAQAGVRYAKTHPDAYLKSNLEGFLSILEICKEFPSVKLIYASSSSVYGTNEKIPFSETDRTDFPANLYAATKKANEMMAYSYHHLYGIHATALRYFTVYGPWGRPDMAYFSFAESILAGKPIRLFNQGNMRWDFTYIDDIVAGTISALDLGAPWEIFNLGNSDSIELLHFVELIEQKLQRKAHIILEKESPGEVETTFAEISHAKKRLNYSPATSLSKGLSSFIEWYFDYYKMDAYLKSSERPVAKIL